MERKKNVLRLSALSVGAALVCTGVARAATVSLDFNGSDQYTPNFSSFTHSGGTSAGFSYSSTAGVADQGGNPGGGVSTIHTPSTIVDSTTVYTPQTFNLADGAQSTISEFVKYTVTNSSSDKPLQLGYVNGTGKGFNGDTGTSFISARITGNNFAEIQYALNGSTQSVGGSSFTSNATSGDWLKLTFVVTETNTSTGAFSASYTVEDYGPSGTAVPTTLLSAGPTSFTTGLGVATLANMNAGWRTTTIAGTTYTPAYDNFAVTATPEPASLGLLAPLAAYALRRRARNA